MQIDISFETWKRLTAHLLDEDDTHDRVIRGLLDQHKPADPQPKKKIRILKTRPRGLYLKEAFLPEGTQLRATYKGQSFFARIEKGEWLDEGTGKTRTSPSQAASAITGSASNGWLFWKVKTPDMSAWKPLLTLRKKDG